MKAQIKHVWAAVLIAVIVIGTGLAWHARAEEKPPEAGAPPAMPPMPVVVETLRETNAQIWNEYSGRLEAVDYVAIRPQVSGTITEIRFEDGQTVKKDDILFVIDPRKYQASVAQAEAALAAARSQHNFAQKDLTRAKDLVKSDALSERLLDERDNSAKLAKNAIAGAEAQLRQARLDLEHAYVKAPITGRVSRAELTEGNLVEAGPGAPVLTTIVSSDKIYADFQVDEQTYLRHVRGKTHGVEAEREVPVELTVRGDTDKIYKGTIHSFDNRIDTATGTIRARALFDNDDGVLLPGMFVSVKLGSSGAAPSILIPETAVGTDQDRKFVYVVGPDNKVQYREVKLGANIDSRRVVNEGLKSGEKIIVEGLMKLRPDMPVAPQEKPEAAPLAPPPAADDAAPLAEATPLMPEEDQAQPE